MFILGHEQILSKYAPIVHKVAYIRTGSKFDADDIMQEVFLRFINCGTIFNDENHIKSWLIRAAVNCSKNLLSSLWFTKTQGLDDSLRTQEPHCDEVLPIVMNLPEKHRVVILLFYYEDMTTAEIAEALGKKEPTVRSLLHRARLQLKEMLGDDFE